MAPLRTSRGRDPVDAAVAVNREPVRVAASAFGLPPAAVAEHIRKRNRRSSISLVLISFSDLPGVGKTTIARELARQIGAVHLSIDTMEEAIRSSIGGDDDRYRAAYRAALELARDNLRLGRTVITDCVNPMTIARDVWRDMARSESAALTEVEIV